MRWPGFDAMDSKHGGAGTACSVHYQAVRQAECCFLTVRAHRLRGCPMKLLRSLVIFAGFAAAHPLYGQTTPRNQIPSRWVIAPKPSISIGAVEGAPAYLFSQIVGVTRLSNGSIVVADRGSHQIRFFDNAGQHLKSVGRQGQGPGEFEHMRALLRCGGDSIFAFDLHWDQKVYTPGGRLVREQRLTLPTSGFRSPYELGCSSRGMFVAQAWSPQVLQPQHEFYRTSARIFILTRDGNIAADLGDFPNSERLSSTRGNRPHPFGRQTAIAIGRDRVYVGTAERMEVWTYDFAGKRGNPFLGPSPDLTIRPVHLAAYLEERVATVDDSIKPRLRREIPRMPLPSSFPAYTSLRLDSMENLWVERFPRPGELQRSWLVFSRAGHVIAEVIAVKGLRVLDIGNDYVLGVHTDDDGVERVQLHALIKD